MVPETTPPRVETPEAAPEAPWAAEVSSEAAREVEVEPGVEVVPEAAMATAATRPFRAAPSEENPRR